MSYGRVVLISEHVLLLGCAYQWACLTVGLSLSVGISYGRVVLISERVLLWGHGCFRSLKSRNLHSSRMLSWKFWLTPAEQLIIVAQYYQNGDRAHSKFLAKSICAVSLDFRVSMRSWLVCNSICWNTTPGLPKWNTSKRKCGVGHTCQRLCFGFVFQCS